MSFEEESTLRQLLDAVRKLLEGESADPTRLAVKVIDALSLAIAGKVDRDIVAEYTRLLGEVSKLLSSLLLQGSRAYRRLEELLDNYIRGVILVGEDGCIVVRAVKGFESPSTRLMIRRGGVTCLHPDIALHLIAGGYSKPITLDWV